MRYSVYNAAVATMTQIRNLASLEEFYILWKRNEMDRTPVSNLSEMILSLILKFVYTNFLD